MELRRPKNCPKCGSMKIMEILYGRPNSEGWEAVERGEMTLGGCFIMPGQPDWECAGCGYRWLDPEDPARIKREKLFRDLIDADPSSSEDDSAP